MTKVELQQQVIQLQANYRTEMVRQNSMSSTSRSYAQADNIRDGIRAIEKQIRELT